jgi:hypothetical protein
VTFRLNYRLAQRCVTINASAKVSSTRGEPDVGTSTQLASLVRPLHPHYLQKASFGSRHETAPATRRAFVAFRVDLAPRAAVRYLPRVSRRETFAYGWNQQRGDRDKRSEAHQQVLRAPARVGEEESAGKSQTERRDDDPEFIA